MPRRLEAVIKAKKGHIKYWNEQFLYFWYPLKQLSVMGHTSWHSIFRFFSFLSFPCFLSPMHYTSFPLAYMIIPRMLTFHIHPICPYLSFCSYIPSWWCFLFPSVYIFYCWWTGTPSFPCPHVLYLTQYISVADEQVSESLSRLSSPWDLQSSPTNPDII